LPEAIGNEVDQFETEIELRKQGKIDEKVFAETRLRRGAYGQRYDNGQRSAGAESRKLPFADKPTKAGFAQAGSVGARLAELCHEEGLIIRAIGEIIAFCPPLVITGALIDEMFDRFGRALKRLPVDFAKAA